MGAPVSGMDAAGQPAAEMLLNAFKTIDPAERQRHEAVLDYWLSIRGNRELPPLRDLDPLEISDAAPSSALLELVGGGEDAEIRHLGEQLRSQGEADRVSEAPRPSILASIGRKLSIVAVSRNCLAFEDDFSAGAEKMRCWVTLLPLSSAGAWVDYVYAFVSFGPARDAQPSAEPEVQEAEAAELVEPGAEVEETEVAEAPAEVEEAPAEVEDAATAEPIEAEVEPQVEETVAEPEEDVLELDSPVEEPEPAAEEVEDTAEIETPAAPEPKQTVAEKKAGFTFDASATGFYATKAVKVKPTLPATEPPKKVAPVKADATPVAEDETPAPQDEEMALPPTDEAAPPKEST